MKQVSVFSALKRYGKTLLAAASVAALGVFSLQSTLATAGPQVHTNLEVELAGGQPVYGPSAQATPGDALNFKVYLLNTGDATGVNPRIVEHLDSRLTYVPNSSYVTIKGDDNQDHRIPLSDSYIKIQNAGHDITWAFTDMAPMPRKSIYLEFKTKLADANQFPVGATTYTNTATSSFEGVSATTNAVSYTVTRYATPVTSFSIRNEVKDLTLGYDKWYDADTAIIAPGDRVAYRMVVLNTGNTSANNVVVKNVLPANFTYAGNMTVKTQTNTTGTPVSGNAIVNGGYVIPTLNSGTGAYQQIQFEAIAPTICPAAPLTQNGVAQVIYNGAVKASDIATTSIVCTRGLTVIKDILNPATNQYVDSIGKVAPNQVLTYRIQVGNNGTTTAVNPTLRDVLPAGVSYVPNTLTIDREVVPKVNQDEFFSTGMVLTTFDPGHGKVITLQVKVQACLPEERKAVNTAYLRANNVAEVNDTASSIIPKCGTNVPPVVVTTPTPTPVVVKPTPKPATPTQLPETGPAEDLLLVGITSGLGTGAARYYKLRKALQNSLTNLDIR